MATDLKRFTISITDEMERDLYEARKEVYYADTQSEMIRDLIARGLFSLKVEKTIKEKDHERSA
jgi:hypothetical protein